MSLLRQPVIIDMGLMFAIEALVACMRALSTKPEPGGKAEGSNDE